MKAVVGDNSLLGRPGTRRSLATALYRDRSLSLARAARFAGVPLAEFIRYVSRCGIPVVQGTATEVGQDAQAIVEWTHSSSPRAQAG